MTDTKLEKSPDIPPENDSEFLETYDASVFDHPSVTVDVALISVTKGSLWTLLVRRREPPFSGYWALPGGFVGLDESLEEAASRVLSTKAGLSGVFLEQLYTFGQPDRDPRTRVITVAYYALLDREQARRLRSQHEVLVSRVAVDWEGETGGPATAFGGDGDVLELAFDHGEILGMVVRRLRGKLDYSPIGFELLPPRFTLHELQTVHETLLGRPLNKDSFRRRMTASGVLEATGVKQADVGHRPAELYRLNKEIPHG